MNLTELLIAQCGVKPGELVVTRMDTDGAGTVNYIGFAPRGSLASARSWTIFHYTYTGDDVTLIESSGAGNIWDNRAALTYA